MPTVDEHGHLRAASLGALIEARAASTPDEPMLFDEHDRSRTFAQYADEVRATAARLAAHGIGRGDVVAWQLPTRIETVVLTGALAVLGAVQVPVLPIHRERELRFILRQSRARVLCHPGTWRGYDHAALAARVRDELGTFYVLACTPQPELGAATSAAAAPAPPEPPEPPDEGDTVRWIFYSSGTTADPKGVMHVDRAAMASGRAMALGQGMGQGDRYGLAFPFTHIGGLTNLAGCLATGFALILLEAFEPAHAVDVFARHGATIAGGGPAFIRAYLEQQRARPGDPVLPALRYMTSGGTPMPPTMHDEVRDELGGRGCCHGYGMTETCSILALNHPGDTDHHLRTTSGRVVAGMEARVVRADGTVAASGDEGELRVRGDLLLVGYVDASLDADAFDADGWFRTGDLGRIDEAGYVHVTGRLKDIIIRKGENISAKEIEDLLYAHPAIAEVAVIGLPDDERGELVCAVVAAAPGATAPDLAAVRAFLDGQRLMRQKYPERVEVVDALPRNASGKVQKNQLIDRFCAGGTPAA